MNESMIEENVNGYVAYYEQGSIGKRSYSLNKTYVDVTYYEKSNNVKATVFFCVIILMTLLRKIDVLRDFILGKGIEKSVEIVNIFNTLVAPVYQTNCHILPSFTYDTSLKVGDIVFVEYYKYTKRIISIRNGSSIKIVQLTSIE